MPLHRMVEDNKKLVIFQLNLKFKIQCIKKHLQYEFHLFL